MSSLSHLFAPVYNARVRVRFSDQRETRDQTVYDHFYAREFFQQEAGKDVGERDRGETEETS